MQQADGWQNRLQESIESSWDLLKPQQRLLLCQLAFFCGGCSVEAAECVCDGEEVLCGIRDLDKCFLVIVEIVGDASRVRLLDAVRSFAMEHLSAEEFAAVRRRHVSYYARLAEAIMSESIDRDPRGSLDRLIKEQANCHEALLWCLSVDPPEGRNPVDILAGIRLAVALWRFWEAVGRFNDGLEWLLLAEKASRDVEDPLRARVYEGLAVLTSYTGDFDAARLWLDRARVLFKACGEHLRCAESEVRLGLLLWNLREIVAARMCFESALAAGQDHGYEWCVFAASIGLAKLEVAAEEYKSADSLHRTALRLARKLGRPKYLAEVIQEIGIVAWFRHDWRLAQQAFHESLALFQRMGDTYSTARSLWGLGNLARAQREIPTARRYYAQLTEIVVAGGYPVRRAYCLEAFAHLAMSNGDCVRAARLLGLAESFRDTPGSPALLVQEERELATLARRVQSELGLEAFLCEKSIGRASDWHEIGMAEAQH